MLELLNNYDREAAFGYASNPEPCPGFNGSSQGFDRGDVEEIAGADEGENDGPAWVIYGKLKDGRWFYLEAGCDYTGWDCQASGRAWVAENKENILKLGLNDDAARRMGITR